MNWKLLLEALAGQAPSFTDADTRKLRIVVSGVGFMAVLFLWTAIAWMGGPPAPVAVRGTLAHQGSAVEQGEIEFSPAPGEKAQRHSIKVEMGKFLLPAWQGLLRNRKYVVRVKAYKKTGRVYENADSQESADEYEQYLPGKYNSDSELSYVADRASLSKGLELDLR